MQGETRSSPAAWLLRCFLLWTDTAVPFLPKSFLEGRRVVAVDLLGWGKSPKPRDCDYSIEEHVSWIERTVIAPLNISTFHVVGHSMGCLVGAVLAARNPGQSGVCLPLLPSAVLAARNRHRVLSLCLYSPVSNPRLWYWNSSRLAGDWGHSMGCLVGAVLAARNRHRVLSLCLYSPVSSPLSQYRNSRLVNMMQDWGHSMGCLIAAVLAARNRDRVVSLCLYSPPFIPPQPGLTPAEEFYRLVTPRCFSPALLMGVSGMSWPHASRGVLPAGHPVAASCPYSSLASGVMSWFEHVGKQGGDGV
ncbi:unnamed protein product [Closterium sp. NIES-64]|nr:unnamed protein product [Closterium sp. NIES-64]